MQERKNIIKILISHHKESELIESDIMMPIQVGAENSKVDLHIQRDDEGNNISKKNDRYCELTAQYWAWKNLEADYYGFMHYRRHFAFRDIAHPCNDGVLAPYQYIDQVYLEELGLEDEAIRRCVGDCDLILPLPMDVFILGAISNEVQFSSLRNQHATDFDMICKTATALYPDYSDAVLEFRTGHFTYFYNMFVMKKEIFMEYSQWLFHILETAEGKIDFSQYNQEESRVLAFMAERLLNIFVIKLLKDKRSLKLKHLKVSFVLNTDLGTNKNFYGVEKAYQELISLPLPYDMESLFPIKDYPLNSLLREKTLKFYGGGNWCRQFLYCFDKLGIRYPVEIWDRDAREGQTLRGVPVVKPDFASVAEQPDVLWIITVYNRSVSDSIKSSFSNHGVTDVVECREFAIWLSRQLWKIACEEAQKTDGIAIRSAEGKCS